MKHLTIFLTIICVGLVGSAIFLCTLNPAQIPNNGTAISYNNGTATIIPLNPIEDINEVAPDPTPKTVEGISNISGVQVSVSGSVCTADYWKTYTDPAYSPTYIKLTDKETGEGFGVNVIDCSYSVSLLNLHRYDVKGYWNGTAGVSRVSQATDLTIESCGGAVTANLVFPTP